MRNIVSSAKRILRTEFVIVSAALIAFILLYFSPTFIQGRLPLSSSYILGMYPWKYYAEKYDPGQVSNNILSDEYDAQIPSMQFFLTQLRQGEYPLWNPNVISGQPYGLIFFPYNFSIYRLTTLIAGMQWGTILYMSLKLYIVGIFAYLYLRKRGFAWWSALAGGLVLMFSANMIVTAMRHVSDSIVYAPAILYFAESFIERKRYRHFAALAFFVGITIISGFPAVTLYTLLLLSFYLAYRNLVELREYSFRDRIRNLLSLYLAFAVGIAWVAFTLLPTYEFIRNVNVGYRVGRGTTVLSRVFAAGFFNPNVCGNPIQGTWYCPGNYSEGATNVGLLPLMLIPLSLANRKYRSTALFFVGAALLVTMIVFGIASVNRLVGRLPLFNFNSNTRMVAELPLCFAFVTATGLDTLSKIGKKGAWSLLFFFLLGLGTIYVFRAVPAVWPRTSATAQQYLSDQRLTTLLFLAAFTILMAMIFFGRAARLALILLVAVCFLERTVLLHGYEGASDAGAFYPETATSTFLESKLPSAERIVVVGRQFVPSLPLYYSINSLTGHSFATVQFKQNMRLINPGIYAGSSTQPILSLNLIDLTSPLLDLYRVRYVVTSPDDDPIWMQYLASQREFNQLYTLDHASSFRQTLKIARAGYAGMLEVRLDTPGQQPVLVNLKMVAGQELLVQIDGQLTSRGNGWYSIELPRVKLQQGQEVYFELKPGAAQAFDNLRLFMANRNVYRDGALFIDGEIIGDSTFSLVQYNPDIAAKYEQVHSGDMNIYENKTVGSGIPVVNQVRYSDQASCATTLGQTDVFQQAVVEDPALRLGPGSSKSVARITHASANQIVIEADVEQAPSMVVLSDAYDPGWQARIDGTPSKIYRVNCAMRGVIVPPGNHIIQMSYQPLSFKIGASISLLVLLSLFAGGFILKSRRRREGQPVN